MDIFSFSDYYYKGYEWDFQKEVINNLPVDAGRYYVRNDLYYATEKSIPYHFELFYNDETKVIEGKVFNYREYRQHYPSVMEIDSNIIRSAGFCRANINYIGPQSLLKIYYPG